MQISVRFSVSNICAYYIATADAAIFCAVLLKSFNAATPNRPTHAFMINFLLLFSNNNSHISLLTLLLRCYCNYCFDLLSFVNHGIVSRWSQKWSFKRIYCIHTVHFSPIEIFDHFIENHTLNLKFNIW